MIRKEANHFQVEELLGFTPGGEGEHCFLYIQKTAENTEAVARKLAAFAGVPMRSVSYCGLKDRNAVTRQWFSVHLPKRDELCWGELNSPRLRVLKQAWHQKKLRRGVHHGNRFRITITDMSGDLDCLSERLGKISASGVPNYFGDQRFGREGNNLIKAEEMLLLRKKIKHRHLRSLYVSAARSILFNMVLSERVAKGNWNQVVPGDVMMLEGGESVFSFDPSDETLANRTEALKIHPTGPLWGKGGKLSAEEAHAIESKALEPFQAICWSLEASNLAMQRRSLRLLINSMHWEWVGDGKKAIVLGFELCRGGFATAVLKELVCLA